MRVLRRIGCIWTLLLGIVALAFTLALAGRFVLPQTPWVHSPRATVTPSDGAIDVIPRSEITFSFSQPMNRRSVEAAVQITPPISGDFVWEDNHRALTFTPDAMLTAGVTYTVTLTPQALGRWWQPLDEPAQVAFGTARSPTVVAALPDSDDVATDAAIALIFSQPMIGPETLDIPVELPQLRIEPPLTGTARWVAHDTLLFRPDGPMRPATRYTATIAALTDVRGTELGQPVSWRWTTQMPALLDHRPAASEQWVAPRQPLVLTFAQPLDPEALRASLQITPTIVGEFSAATLPDNTQLVTFTPAIDWEPDRAYEVGLATGPPSTPRTWSFTTAPAPGLAGNFPGQGQLLPRNQNIRLIFSTPMDNAALQAGMTLDPPVEGLGVSVNDTQVRVQAELQPSTAYTLTIAAGVTDRNGVPLGSDYRLSFLTEPAAPSLTLSEVTDRFFKVPVDQPVVLNSEYTNLSALDLSLYRLDEATLLRTFSFSEEDWRDFRPERYNQTPLNAWRVPLDTPPNQVVQTALSITDTESPVLAPGAYYVQIRTPEGPQQDVVVLVSNIELVLQQSPAEILVWALDRATGEPVANLPLTLYKGDAIVARSQSNADGLWQVVYRQRQGDPPYVVVAGGAQPAVTSSGWQAPLEPAANTTRDDGGYRSALMLDRAVYTAGDTVRIGGFVRQRAPDGTFILPQEQPQLDLALLDLATNTVISRTALTLPASGVINTSLALAPSTPLGSYGLRATVKDDLQVVPLRIAPRDPPLDVAFDHGAALSANRLNALPLTVTDEGAPIGGAAVNWNIQAAAVDVPAAVAGGFHFENAEETFAPPPASGIGQTDPTGRFAIPLPDATTLTQTVRYDLTAVVQEAGGPRAEANTTLVVPPTGPRVGVRLPRQVITTNERAAAEALVIDATNTPIAGAEVVLDLYRHTVPSAGAATAPGDPPLLTQRATSDAQGQIRLELPLLDGGTYQVVVRAGISQSTTTLWVAAPDFTDWSAEPGQIVVVPDQAMYQPGDTARLLVGVPANAATLLTAIEHSDVISAEVQATQAGQLLTVPVTAEMAPRTRVGVVAAPRSSSSGNGALLTGSAEITVAQDTPELRTTVTAAQPDYRPGATATLTITTTDEAGNGVPANVVLAVTEHGVGNDTSRFDRALATGPSGRVAYWNAVLQTEADGTGTVQVRLPAIATTWQVDVFAAGETALLSYAHTALTTTLPLVIERSVPSLLRVGDQTRVGLVVRNTTPVSREVRASVAASGVVLAPDVAPTQTQVIDPGTAHRFDWPIVVEQHEHAVPAAATFRFGAEASDIERRQTIATVSIEPGGTTRTHAQTFQISRPLSTTIPISGLAELSAADCVATDALCPWAKLELEIAPDVRSAVVRSATFLAAQTSRTVEEEASLVILSTTLARYSTDEEQRRWQTQVQQSLDTLAAAQDSNGGWAWWPGGAVHPFMTSYVLEAQATASTILPEALVPDPRVLKLLREADHPGTDPNLRAYIQYVLRLVGEGNAADVRALRSLDLDADGLAYLALTLPAAQADEPLAGLLALAQPTTSPAADGTRLVWEPNDTAPLARSAVSTTALAIQALQRLQPDSSQISPALRTLRMTWGVEGWPTAFDAARAAGALLAAERAAPQVVPPLTLALNEQPLLGSGQALATTRPIILSGAQLQAQNTLEISPQVTASGFETTATPTAEALVAYRLTEQVQDEPRGAAPLLVYQDYLDPQTGALLDPQALRLGQLVRLRLTLVTQEALPFVALHAPLPANVVPITVASESSAFATQAKERGLRFFGTDLAPGVYTRTALVRPIAVGAFTAPPPHASPAFATAEHTSGPRQRIQVVPPHEVTSDE